MIQENLGTPEERYHCGNGRKRFGPRTLNDVHGYGYLTMEEIIIKSSNIGAAEMGIRLGKERVFHVLDQLGFGHKNHLPFAGEPRGTLRHFSKWTDHYSITSIPMGHEISVNMIQMARAYGALANGGTVIQSCLEKAIVSYDGIEERRGGGLPIDRVFSQNTCDVTLRALEGVVQKGTARRAKSKIYRIGGKTGTTEKIVDGKYSKEHNIGSFVAIAPLSQPRLVVVVMMDEPKGGMSYGGVVAGPIVRRVIEDSLQYMGVVPDIKQGGDS
jgi:cell division protein FtsI (penicillin-binding protein 3)